MAQFFFILGHQPAISLAELEAVWAARGWAASILGLDRSFVVVEMAEATSDDVVALMRVLGGTIKCGVCWQSQKSLKEEVSRVLERKAGGKKLNFGLSYYGVERPEMILKRPIKNFALEIKKELNTKGRSSRWVESKEAVLSSVVVAKNDLLGDGVEVVILTDGKKVFVGETLAVQDFEDFGRRDFGRPKRDMASGMLPPKLARMMVNLVSTPVDNLDGATLLDPFCGSGTVLMEAKLAGWGKVWGSDISGRAIENSKKNLAWLGAVIGDCEVKVADVKKLSEFWPKASVDAIVCEPYLGPNRGSFEIKETKRELLELYEAALEQFSVVLKPKGVVVWLWPLWASGEGLEALETMDLARWGFEMDEFLDEESRKKIAAERSPHGGLIYRREGQKVAREVLRLRKG